MKISVDYLQMVMAVEEIMVESSDYSDADYYTVQDILSKRFQLSAKELEQKGLLRAYRQIVEGI